ncbi:hypothetical protein PybrP1_007018, partial [[Pythium] brassicae (nom. inval.)]
MSAGVDVVKLLIDGSGGPPLSVAVATNRDEIVKLLLAHGAPVNVKDAQGTTPLMEAAKHGRLELAKLLIKSGAAVDETQRFGRSALMLALSHRQQWIVQWLLKDCGASVATADSAGWSPLHVAMPLDLAVEKGFVDEFRPLRTRGDGDDARLDATLLFMTAAKFGRVGLMNMLRQMGATLHREGVEGSAQDLDGNTTALLSLARWGRVGYFKRLFASCIEHVSDTPDVSNGSAALLRDTLKAIRDLYADIEESEHMYSSVAARLANVGATCMEALREDGNNRMMLADISVIDQLQSSGASVPDVPSWFLSRYNVAFEDWSRAKASTFAKGTLLNASVTILKSDLEAAQISHQNVVDLFGACHVGLPRFF